MWGLGGDFTGGSGGDLCAGPMRITAERAEYAEKGNNGEVSLGRVWVFWQGIFAYCI